jgi:hypothetical protein
MFHGNAIINFMRSSSAEIHTYNDGIAASMAADIWFASPNRHMADNALLMVHPASTFTYGHAKDMREAADLLDKFTATTITIMAKAVGKTKEEIEEAYYKDYKDHWFTAEEALEAGFIDKIEDYEVEMPIEDPQKMTHAQLMKAFREINDQSKQGLFSKFWKATRFGSFSKSKTQIPMNKAELEKSLQDGEITIQEVAEIVGKSNEFKVEKATPPAEAPPADLSAQITAAVTAALKPVQQKMETMEKDIKKIGDEPGAGPTNVPAGSDPGSLTPIQKAVIEDIQKMNQEAQLPSNPFTGAY